MSVYDTTAQNATENDAATTIDQTDEDPKITGPHFEPPEVANATTYWRCSECGYESVREKDLYRASFHAADCAHSEGEH
jgi:rubrerythrin